MQGTKTKPVRNWAARTCGECFYLRVDKDGYHRCKGQRSIRWGLILDPDREACSHMRVKA